MMKLHAFDDRKEDERKDVGRHHALDLYTIGGLMTEPEYEGAVRLGRESRENPQVQRAREIVAGCFSEPGAIGLLRVREHPLFRPDFNLPDFLGVLAEVFTS